VLPLRETKDLFDLTQHLIDFVRVEPPFPIDGGFLKTFFAPALKRRLGTLKLRHFAV
jgi:hypothetical protein